MSSPRPTSEPWKAIAAMAENRVIGNHGTLPWNVPGDFKWVKKCTHGQAIVMGRKTFESIGKPLPGRLNIVLSRSCRELDGCLVLPGLEALKQFRTERELWIFGGAKLYEQALPFVGDLYLTLIRAQPEGDTFFPEFENRFNLVSIIESHPTHEIRHYRNQDIAPLD